MAKYDVTYACSHTETVQLFGPEPDRQRKLAWLRGQDCRACQQASQEAARRAANEQASAANATAGLAPLTGSAKQVAWAETIRAEALASSDNQADLPRPTEEQVAIFVSRTGLSAADFDAIYTACLAVARRARHELEQQTDAAWWIDNRGTPILTSGMTPLNRRVMDAVLAERRRMLDQIKGQ